MNNRRDRGRSGERPSGHGGEDSIETGNDEDVAFVRQQFADSVETKPADLVDFTVRPEQALRLVHRPVPHMLRSALAIVVSSLGELVTHHAAHPGFLTNLAHSAFQR